MPKVKKIFTEYGLDFDNNKYGFGPSTIEKRSFNHTYIIGGIGQWRNIFRM